MNSFIVEGVGPLQQGLRQLYDFRFSFFCLPVEGVGPLQQGLRRMRFVCLSLSLSLSKE